MPALSGVIPPVVTPRSADRSFDHVSFERVIARLLAAGVDGIFVLGSTGEVAFATATERREVLTAAVRIVAGRVPVLAGIVDTQTSRVLEHLDDAVRIGADGVVATAPFYAVTSPAATQRHFDLIGERSSVPVYAYDLPVAVHSKLDADMLVELGRSGAIAGVKDSSGDDVGFRRLALKNRAAGEPLALFTGHELVVDGAYLAGAHGCVPGLGNVDPAGYVALDRAARSGDFAAARSEQDRLAALMEMCFAPTGVSGWGAGVGAFKTALQLLGVIDSNAVPEPFSSLTGNDVDAVRSVLERHGPRP